LKIKLAHGGRGLGLGSEWPSDVHDVKNHEILSCDQPASWPAVVMVEIVIVKMATGEGRGWGWVRASLLISGAKSSRIQFRHAHLIAA